MNWVPKYSARKVAILAALAMSASVAMYSNSWAQARDGGEVTFAVPGGLLSPADMIRFKVSIDATQGGNIYDSLYRTLPDGSVIPWLAEETMVSPDGLKWTLKLRKGVKFHDGTPFDAESVKWNIEERQREKAFQLAGQIKPITAVNVIDENSVEFVLSQPVASLQVALSAPQFGIQSPTAYKKYADPADYAIHAAGTGPFKLSDVPGTPSELELVRNDEYWAGKPHLEKLTFVAMPDQASRVASLEAGDIQYGAIPLSDIQRLSEGKEVRVLTTEKPVSNHYIYVNLRNSITGNVKVRQALAYAMNQDDLVKLQFGLGVPADSMGPSSVVGYSAGNPYSYNPEKAKELLKEAGVQPGTKLRLATFPNGPHVDFARLLKQQFDAIGFDVTIDVSDLAGFTSTISNQTATDWQLAMSTSPPHYQDIESIYTRRIPTGVSGNYGGYSNPEAEKLLAEQSRALDPAARQKVLDELQQIIFTDLPMIPFASYRSPMGAALGLHDVVEVGLSTFYFDKAWIEN